MKHYYFFTAKSFTSKDFKTDEEAVAGKPEDCVRVMRAKDSIDIWVKPSTEKA